MAPIPTDEGFDTIAELPHLGGGDFIRFVLRGDHVDVYLYERAADSSPSDGYQASRH